MIIMIKFLEMIKWLNELIIIIKCIACNWIECIKAKQTNQLTADDHPIGIPIQLLKGFNYE